MVRADGSRRTDVSVRRAGDKETRRARYTVLGIAGLALLFKVLMAFRTWGSGDISHWTDFSNGVREAGPIGVYGLTWPGSFYNHPPVIGYLLELVNGLEHLGLPLRATIRIVSSLADVATSLIIFELLRRRGTVRLAMWSGLLVGVSPVLFTVSGFHGNTDPVFTMLTMLSLLLLTDRDRPALAGIAMGLAVGVKIVPVVAVPALLVYAAMTGRRTFVRYVAGLGATFVITWGPALALQGKNVIKDVVGYNGSSLRQWGLVQIGHWFGDPWWSEFLIGPGRFLVLVLCCGLPAYFVWRRPSVVAPAVGLSLVAFLMLSPAFGVQYTVWPVAGAYLIGFGSATFYNLSAGWMTFAIYNAWNGGLPWYRGHSLKYSDNQVAIGLLAWVALVLLCVEGLRTLTGRLRTPADGPPAVTFLPRPSKAARRRT
ncbi:Dolichyl-phosphate-mannose-protein mannosyltransferase [Nakamurella panacisegetis]|uniref:Dolichyl-phosphate-mannose-protein mannosyltransferase n=1 Tax=Nakamurella panacisegetis TaxID=1090615 RepID=A0A1H0SBQ6_9ACTN|nr:glycosyltransferase family 39 protein [Nakamurella panacisegetis]SDP39193.1 Dolichyl-phosphate-mannose-protein mannosyltransferase [Nakamurella panacisegetis]